MTKNKIPSRSITPDTFAYVAINMKRFSELVNDFNTVLESQAKKKHGIEIRIRGYNDAFKSVEDFTNTVLPTEWIKIKTINIAFYPLVIDDNYGRTLELELSGTAIDKSGLVINYGDNIENLQRLAIKEKVEVFLPEYKRNVYVNDYAVSVLVVVLTLGGWVTFFAVNSTPQTPEKLFGHGLIFILVSLLFTLEVIIFGMSLYLSRKIVPHFETLNENNQSRLKKLLKILGGFVFLLTLSVTIIQLILWTTGAK